MFIEKEILEFLNSFSGTNKDLKYFKDARVMEDYSTEEQLEEKILWLKSELNLKTLELADKERYYTDKIEKLEQKVENLKEDRKHLLQDKNAVINLTKGLLNDIVGCDTWEANLLIVKYLESLNNLNLGSNDSNTKTYLELKQSRDHFKRLVNIYKRKFKEEIDKEKEITQQAFKKNQDLVNEINKLKEENADLKEQVDTLKIDNNYLIGKMRCARTELCFDKKGE